MTDWHPAIASGIAEHYIAAEEYERSQKVAIGSLLLEVIDAIGLPPGGDPSEGWFKSIYSIADLRKRLSVLGGVDSPDGPQEAPR